MLWGLYSIDERIRRVSETTLPIVVGFLKTELEWESICVTVTE